MKQELYEMLKAEAVADKNKALLSLNLLTNHPAGIGDHSTKDYWDNATEALKLLASADERLEILEKYFNEGKINLTD
jgi:hypothetical protein|tara:strand:+ start:228 stop:458 length:231 start_codon:yes stop_codon:yes gene_type:complete